MDYSKAEAKLAAREQFTGLWAAITVPFGTDGGIDEAALRADLDWLTGALGIDGIFSGGVMSEFWALSGAERRRLTELVVERVRGATQNPPAGLAAPFLHHGAAALVAWAGARG